MFEDMTLYKPVRKVAPGGKPVHRCIRYKLLAWNAGDVDLIRGSQFNEVFIWGEGCRDVFRTILRKNDIRQETGWTAVSSTPRQGKHLNPSPGSSQQSVAKTSAPNRLQEAVKPSVEFKLVLEIPPVNSKVSCSLSLRPAPILLGNTRARGLD